MNWQPTLATLLAASCCLVSRDASAVSPEAITPQAVQQGRMLFEREWTSGDPAFGNDGLGPLFNAKSCVACHHQGGVGGGGDSRFNAQAIGIDAIRIGGAGNRADVNRLVRIVHPDFVRPDGTWVTTATLPHFGGSLAMRQLRDRYHQHSTSEFAEQGGAATPADVRENMEASWKWSGHRKNTTVDIEARIFQRNTTALFGSGLIDQVSNEDLERLQSIQQRDPEISGRVSILEDGSYGRFGWRANRSRLFDFVDNACANEMGLETKRSPQGRDVATPNYQNPGIDIGDHQIRQMTHFVAALPNPQRELPEDSHDRELIKRGEAAFTSIGCAKCHVQDVGPAKGLYSDLLLHDMGDRNYDYDAAEPYVVKTNVVRQYVQTAPTTLTAYYGDPVPIAGPGSLTATATTVRPGYFRTPRGRSRSSDVVPLANGRELSVSQTRNGRTLTTRLQEQLSMRRRIAPSMVTQEWRTPPLWGVADSAPYMHDGRAETLLEAVAMHGGEAKPTRDRFLNLPFAQREAVIAFMKTMVAPQDVPAVTH